jgi:signal transduction histidine kinase/AraC-like DNA-binding protein
MAMPAKILVVDDEPQLQRLILQLFRRHVRNGKYAFFFAQSGEEALEILRREKEIAIVLCDINMPGMNGFDLLAEIPAVNPLIRTVMVSAYGDMKNIRRVMNLGAYDFVTKPIDFNDLEATIEKTLREVEVLKQAKRAEELSQKNEQLRELDQLKSQFFTNISHDLRTPLTIITGMADQIEENPERWFSQGIQMIKRNGRHLLDLVNQILDLRKLEAGKLELQLVQGDVIQYLRSVLELFESSAEQKDIQLRFQSEGAILTMDYDPRKLFRVLSNLLSNALKFTPEGGAVELVVESRRENGQEYLRIIVRDTGTGIPADQLPHIFDHFYQVSMDEAQLSPSSPAGSGVGLAIVRELVKLMKGTIEVNSLVGEGTTFKILLPVQHKAERQSQASPGLGSVTPEMIPEGVRQEAMLAAVESSDALPSLLIVEDNADLRQYLISLLEGRYRLEIAVDGQEGVDKAIEIVPDLIVSDVMMPRKDGYALCQELKNDERTSHIPIVLLTAKADDDSRISGLERGADAYLAKPFNRQELQIRLAKLWELRQQLQKKYGALENLPPVKNLDDEFIAQVRQTVEDNIDDEDFGIEELSRAVGMSRSQLHRKLKALTGLSTSHFVRSIRVHRAKTLLINTDLNISQVAYEVGFRDPKYFNRSFNEVFGHSPKEVRKEK